VIGQWYNMYVTTREKTLYIVSAGKKETGAKPVRSRRRKDYARSKQPPGKPGKALRPTLRAGRLAPQTPV